jgi:hypothetical protein
MQNSGKSKRPAMNILLILTFFSLWVSVFHVFKISTYGVTLSDLLMLVLYIGMMIKLIWDGEKYKFAKNPALIALLGFVFVVIISGFHPLLFPMKGTQLQFMKTTIHILFLIAFVYVCAIYPFKEKTWTTVIKVWLITALILNIFGIYQVFARAFDLPLAWFQLVNAQLSLRGELSDSYRQLSIHFGNFYRATSIFSEPSALAAFNVFIILFLFVPIIQKRKPFFRSKFLNATMMFFAVAAEFMAFSLTGVLNISIMIFFALLFEKRFRLRQLLYMFAAAVPILIVFDYIASSQFDISIIDLFYKRINGIFHSIMGDTGKTISGESLSNRMQSIIIGINIWQQYPLLGTGLGLTQYFNEEGRIFLDNASAVLIAETGMIGYITFLSVFFILVYKTIWLVINKNSISDENTARLAGLIFYMIINVMLYGFGTANNLISTWMWMPVGYVVGVYNLVKRSQNKDLIEFRLVDTSLKSRIGKIFGQYLDVSAEKNK